MLTNIHTQILGTGSFLPEQILTNQDLEKILETNHEWIVERTGICQRHVAAPEEATSDLAINAARKALQDANVTADEIDLIIVATLTPDYLTPATACIVQHSLGARNAAAFDLEAACSGFITALSVAHSMISAGLKQRALVIGAECMSRVLNWDDRKTAVLFGDGAGAVVLGHADQPHLGPFTLGADGSGEKFLYVPAGGSRQRASERTVIEHLHGIHMDGSEVFKFAVRAIGTIADDLLTQGGLSIADIDLFIPHQANSRIIEAALKRLKITDDKVFVNLHRTANTSAASIPIALDLASREGRLHYGMQVMLAGFGAGLTWGGCLMTWSKRCLEQ